MPQAIVGTYLMQQVARASAALEAAGAWDTAPTDLQCSDLQQMAVLVTYTQGAAGGAVDIRVDACNDLTGTDWYSLTASNQNALVAGTDTQTSYQANYWTFDPTAAAAERVALGRFELKGTVERVRIVCRESGVVGTPGTAAVEVTFS